MVSIRSNSWCRARATRLQLSARNAARVTPAGFKEDVATGCEAAPWFHRGGMSVCGMTGEAPLSEKALERLHVPMCVH